MSVDYAALDNKRLVAIALKRQRALELRECFDPMDVDSRPNPAQLECMKGIAAFLFRYLQGGNQSGKSQTGGREVAWFFQRNHPYIDIEELWPDDPMVIIVCGRISNQVEELWDKKIKPYLSPDEYRENKQGGTLQYVVNPKNGSKLIFATHHNPAEAREKVQSYSAHYVWLDELTDYLPLIEELQRRVNAKRGRMLVTYTPKIRAEAVKKFIETPTRFSKVYKISMLDNPVYDDRREEILEQIRALPEAQQNTILYGEWYIGESAVFSFDPARHIETPAGYSVLWPHVVAVDPAASGLMGFTLWTAPHQHAHRWYCVSAEYIKGAAPSDLVDMVESKLAPGMQLLYRIADTHESWFFKQAAKMKISYRGVPNKRGRKLELIAAANQALANGRVRLTPAAPDLISELSVAQWSDTVEDKIINASSYHLSDCFQYFVDQMPLFKNAELEQLPYEARLHLANKQRQANEAARAKAAQTRARPAVARIYARRGRSWAR